MLQSIISFRFVGDVHHFTYLIRFGRSLWCGFHYPVVGKWIVLIALWHWCYTIYNNQPGVFLEPGVSCLCVIAYFVLVVSGYCDYVFLFRYGCFSWCFWWFSFNFGVPFHVWYCSFACQSFPSGRTTPPSPLCLLWYCYLNAAEVGAPVLGKGGSFVPRANQGGLHKNRVGKSMTSNDSVIVFVLDDHPSSDW